MGLTAYQKNSHWKTCQKKISRNKYRDFFLKENDRRKTQKEKTKGMERKNIRHLCENGVAEGEEIDGE